MPVGAKKGVDYPYVADEGGFIVKQKFSNELLYNVLPVITYIFLLEWQAVEEDVNPMVASWWAEALYRSTKRLVNRREGKCESQLKPEQWWWRGFTVLKLAREQHAVCKNLPYKILAYVRQDGSSTVFARCHFQHVLQQQAIANQRARRH